MESKAAIRGQLYDALAQAFCKPEAVPEGGNGGDSLITNLQQSAAAFDTRVLEHRVDALVSSLDVPENQSTQALCALEVEYNRLFVGPGRPQALPYESAYRTPRGMLMGPAAQGVTQRYAEVGLVLAPDRHDLPDHVATELGFMAYLAMQEAKAQDRDAQVWINRERAFLKDHLMAWLPHFCREVQQASRHPFYTALADLTLAFTSIDARSLG